MGLKLREAEHKKEDFPETTAFERYAVKTSDKPMCIIAPTYLDRSACYLYLAEAQEVTTKALPYQHAILQSPRPASVETHERTLQLAVPRMRNAPRVCTLQSFS